MSFPVPDNLQSLLQNSNQKQSNVSIIPLLFLPKSDTVQKLWAENIEEKKTDLSTRLGAINTTTFKYLESYLNQLKTIEMSSNAKGKYSLGNGIDLSLRLLKSEIQETQTNIYSRQASKEAHLTSLASRCINEIGKSLASAYFKRDHSIFPGIWMQDSSSKSTFHHEAIDYIEESFGILIERNW
jgi:hypothetical protein